MMNKMSTLGLDERLGRVLAYVFGGIALVIPFGWFWALILGWVPLLILVFVEKNRNVRWHAAQSMFTFGILGLIMFVVGLLQLLLGHILLVGGLISLVLGFLLTVLGWVTLILCVFLIVMAILQRNFRLPFFSRLADGLV